MLAGFPGGSDRQESTHNARDVGSIPPWVRREKWLPPSFREGNGNPLRGESQGQRGLVGYNPWGHKESDTTE